MTSDDRLMRELEAIHAAKMSPQDTLRAQLLAIINEYIRNTEQQPEE